MKVSERPLQEREALTGDKNLSEEPISDTSQNHVLFS